MTICPNCERDANIFQSTPKTVLVAVLELWGLVSWLLIYLSIPHWPQPQGEQLQLGFETWLYPVLDIPAVRVSIIIGAAIGFILFSWDGIQTIRAGKYQHRCKTCGHLWN